MSKISRVSKKTFGDIVRERKLAKAQLAKEKAIAVQTEKDLQFDKFVRNTAREMLQGSAKYNLQVFDADAGSKLPLFSSDKSVWASWSKMFKK